MYCALYCSHTWKRASLLIHQGHLRFCYDLSRSMHECMYLHYLHVVLTRRLELLQNPPHTERQGVVQSWQGMLDRHRKQGYMNTCMDMQREASPCRRWSERGKEPQISSVWCWAAAAVQSTTPSLDRSLQKTISQCHCSTYIPTQPLSPAHMHTQVHYALVLRIKWFTTILRHFQALLTYQWCTIQNLEAFVLYISL